METAPLVSVCIPVYNAADFLSECVQSVINQTYSNLEIILVDNGSTDDSLKIARSFTDKRICTDVERNKSAAKARNKALSVAKGKYIQFLDADDWLSPDKIERQVSALEKEPGKLAVCSTVHFFSPQFSDTFNPSLYEEQYLYTTSQPVDFIINLWGGNDFKASMVQPNAWLTPMEVIARSGKWNESLTLDDDGEFFARVILNSSGTVKTGGFNYYRKHSTTSTHLSAQKNAIALNSAFKAILLKKEVLFHHNTSERASKAIYKQLKELAIQCYLVQPELYRFIEDELRTFKDYKFIPVFGGKFINFISKNIGWKIAKRCQRIYQRVKRS